MKENKRYEYLVRTEYGMSYTAIHQRKHIYKLTTKQLYEMLVKDEEVVLELQVLLSDCHHNDIKHLFNGKNANVIAYQFLINLYAIDTSTVINGIIIKTCRRLLEEIKRGHNETM